MRAWSGSTAGAAGDSVDARGCFLVVDEGWRGPAAPVEVALDLQNGPDALRLVRADGTTDTVGWGELDAAQHYGQGRQVASPQCRNAGSIPKGDKCNRFPPNGPESPDVRGP